MGPENLVRNCTRKRGVARRWLGVVVNNLGSLAKAHMAQAREQIRELVGEIRLAPTADGYLKAVLTARYEGLLKPAVGTKLNKMVARGRILAVFNTPLSIPLRP